MNKPSDDHLTRVGSDVPYSIIIQKPSPDLAELENYRSAETIHVNASAKELVHFCRAFFIPDHIYKCLQECVKYGSYRVEILDGETSYKLYVKPPTDAE
jgi:hypothetical protein